MLELVIYAAALGVSVVYIVPVLASFIKGMLPATVQANFNVPTTYPTTLQAGLWAVAFWGALLGVTLWAISMVHPVGKALKAEA